MLCYFEFPELHNLFASSAMNKKQNPLAIIDSINVENPCHESWEKMTGDSRQRFCELCNKQVHNLSEMTSAQAEELLANSQSRLCVRYYRNADGSVMTSDRRDTHETRFRRVMRRLVVSAAFPLWYCLGQWLQPGYPSLGKTAHRKWEK